MSQLAVGMIETVGLAAGIEAADVCVKSANVHLIGYELTRGNGMTVVKIEGNVGAVKAAIEAATVAANKVSKVFSTKVIPRPSEGIEFLMRNDETIGYENKSSLENSNEVLDKDSSINENIEKNEFKEEIIESKEEQIEKTIILPEEIIEDANEDENFKEDRNLISETNESLDKQENSTEDLGYTCNLCKDPKCPRQKGDLKSACIHYEDQNK